MSEHVFFLLAFALLVLHEMDAIRCREWRIFPGLSLLNDVWGYRVFVWAHVPLLYALLAALLDPQRQQALVSGFDVFAVVHLGLHVLFVWHPKNEFKDLFSWSIIVGAAVCGGLDLLF
jgi:hypothetical protein